MYTPGYAGYIPQMNYFWGLGLSEACYRARTSTLLADSVNKHDKHGQVVDTFILCGHCQRKLLANPQGKREKGAEAVSEENKTLSRRVLEEVFNAGNLEVVDEIISEDFVHHDPAMPEEGHGRESVKESASMYRSAFPDIHMEVEDQIAEGDRVATRWTGTGTHEGDLMGISPTGNRVAVVGMSIDRIAEGQIAETWDYYDALGMMQQVGAIPFPEETQR